ncbi:MAG: DegT/DnrJ/EryC1/StrS aminotransferase family protein [Vicinamibacterales bacterium]
MRSTLLPFSPPSVGDEEIDEVAATLRGEWLTTGPRTQHFERVFAERVESSGALAVSSGTAAMQVALAATGIGPGDEVITTTMTFCATAHVAHHAGARPVIVDVEADTLNIDPAAIERAITPKTRAIMPVHLHGHPAEMNTDPGARACARPGRHRGCRTCVAGALSRSACRQPRLAVRVQLLRDEEPDDR